MEMWLELSCLNQPNRYSNFTLRNRNIFSGSRYKSRTLITYFHKRTSRRPSLLFTADPSDLRLQIVYTATNSMVGFT